MDRLNANGLVMVGCGFMGQALLQVKVPVNQ